MKGKRKNKRIDDFLKNYFQGIRKMMKKMRIKIENKKRVVLKKKILLKIKKRNRDFLLD